MILFDLKCSHGHRFEGWFRNGGTYEAQAACGEITCPVCGDTGIDKAPMAPRIARSAGRVREPEMQAPTPPAAMPDTADLARQGDVLRALREIRRQVEQNAEHVGDRFAEEARKIHYGESDARAIYGETSKEQAEQLRDEGVEFASIPWVPTGN